MRVGDNDNADAIAIFDRTNLQTLFVEQESRNIHRNLRTDFTGFVFTAFFFDQT